MQIGSDHQHQLERDKAFFSPKTPAMKKHDDKLKITRALNKLRIARSELRVNGANPERLKELIFCAQNLLEEVL